MTTKKYIYIYRERERPLYFHFIWLLKYIFETKKNICNQQVELN